VGLAVGALVDKIMTGPTFTTGRPTVDDKSYVICVVLELMKSAKSLL